VLREAQRRDPLRLPALAGAANGNPQMGEG